MTFQDCAKPTVDAIGRLLIEAGSVATNWQIDAFRAHAAREARAIYLPAPDLNDRNKFVAALALRQSMEALGRARTDQGRQCIAQAMRLLMTAVRAERDQSELLAQSASSVEALPAPPPYWIDRE